MKEDLIGATVAICDEIEASFTFLAEVYPGLLREIGKSKEYSDALLGCFSEKPGAESGTGRGEMLRSALGDVLGVIDGGLADFSGIRQNGTESLASLKSGIEDASQLKDIIAGIIDMSGGLEVIALNSMVHALKVGAAGGGFSYIAGEMSQRTDRTIALAKELDDDEEALLNLSRGFYEKADDFDGLISRLFEELGPSFRRDVTALREVARSILDAVASLSAHSQDVKAPLFSLMESIQKQDLIRQSMDQVVRIVNALPETGASDGFDDDSLDNLAFSEQSLRIGISITEDVVRMVRESAAFLGERVGAVEATVDALRGESADLDARFLSDDLKNPGEVAQLLGKIAESRVHVSSVMSSINVAAGEVVGRGMGIVGKADAVRRAAEAMVDTIGGFWNIVIAARMEAVKQEALAGLTQTVDDMDSLVGDIGELAQRTADLATEIHEIIRPALERHEDMMARLLESVSVLSESLLPMSDRLMDSVRSVSAGFRDFSVFSDDFLELFEQSRERTRSLDALADRLAEKGGNLEEMRTAVSRSLAEALSARTLPDWKLHDDRLRDLIEGFTIFANKKTAHELTGAAIEVDHSDEGEVILF